MSSHRMTTVTAAIGVLSLAGVAGAGPHLFSPAHFAPTVQDEVADKREDVKQWTEEIKAHTKQRGDEDEEARQIIDLLMQEWSSLGPKDRALVVKTLDRCFKEKRPLRDDGTRENGLFLTAAVALGEMGGADAAKVLASWIDDKKHKHDLELQRELILGLGRTMDPKGLKPLLGLLKHPEPSMQAWGAEALAFFAGAPEDTRKDIFETILKQLVPLHNEVTGSATPQVAQRERLDAVSGPMTTTLRELSGFEERDPNAFQSWWNDNKKRDWDEE